MHIRIIHGFVIQTANFRLVQAICRLVAQITKFYEIYTVTLYVSIRDTTCWILWPFNPGQHSWWHFIIMLSEVTAYMHVVNNEGYTDNQLAACIMLHLRAAAWHWELAQAKHCMLHTTNVIECTPSLKANHDSTCKYNSYACTWKATTSTETCAWLHA